MTITTLTTDKPITVVAPIDETPLPTFTDDDDALLAQLLKRKAAKQKTLQSSNAAALREVRYGAYLLDLQLKPLYAARQEAAKEHDRLSGVGKIILTDDEKAQFERRRLKESAKAGNGKAAK